MRLHRLTYLIFLLLSIVHNATAQDVVDEQSVADTLSSFMVSEGINVTDSALVAVVDSVEVLATTEVLQQRSLPVDSNLVLSADSIASKTPSLRTRWIPDPKKAMWWAIAFPGLGQIYNRKYWKLPIIYGGLLGCFYALNWNGNMYRDYSQAFSDIMDSNPDTKSYENFLPSSFDVQGRLQYLQDLFKRKKDFYRRYRDLSIFCMIGVYLLAVVDAYVDAELSSFDITRDLTMKVQPTIINDGNRMFSGTSLRGNSYGFQCSLNF